MPLIIPTIVIGLILKDILITTRSKQAEDITFCFSIVSAGKELPKKTPIAVPKMPPTSKKAIKYEKFALLKTIKPNFHKRNFCQAIKQETLIQKHLSIINNRKYT